MGRRHRIETIGPYGRRGEKKGSGTKRSPEHWLSVDHYKDPIEATFALFFQYQTQNVKFRPTMECPAAWTYDARRQPIRQDNPNGTTVLADFDISLAAGAVNKALVEEFTAVADGSGNITIAFTTVTNFPAINAVEILKSVPSVGTTSFLYDPNGSLLSATTPDGSVTTYLPFCLTT